MTLSSEVLLVAAVFAFHYWNSTLLLDSNEFVLEEYNRQWIFALGSSVELRGKKPFFPHPCVPYSAVFKCHWSTSVPPSGPSSQHLIIEFLRTVLPLRWIVSGLFLLLFIIFPVFLFWAPRLWLGLAVGIIYAAIIAATIILWYRRDALGLSRKAVSALAFEMLACPPFAVNMVRRLSLKRPPVLDSLALARQVLTRQKFDDLVRAICAVVDEELSMEEDVEADPALRAFRAHLDAMLT